MFFYQAMLHSQPCSEIFRTTQSHQPAAHNLRDSRFFVAVQVMADAQGGALALRDDGRQRWAVGDALLALDQPHEDAVGAQVAPFAPEQSV